ncbi:unnamed protein product [Fraxinus pennsylvanica]|uniref:Helicase ATP-binding domain-containing protein n=1 Tax=Fraxinus pennsylvanica TaxID=56036 RepID=A0AAD2AHD6_9LAMI|nr:unnamed protein product [Fraxinus pennsylvanica]
MISSTLVICPLAVCKQWVDEINSCISEGSTRVLLYEGTGRKKKVYQFSDYHFVITAYTTLEANYRYLITPKTSGKKEKGLDRSILHSVLWDRIVLDEAHYIKNDRSNTAKAVFDLQSSYKWALSFTLIQNSVKDLHSLCPDKMFILPHIFLHFSWWNKYISTPIYKHGNTGIGRDSMILLKHKILKPVMFRPTKEGRSAELRIHPQTVIERWLTLDETEEGYYKMGGVLRGTVKYAALRKCKVCGGSGLVLRYYFRCPGCGMFCINHLSGNIED